MIVYANEFYLSSSNNGLMALKQALKCWLGKKIGPAFNNTLIIPFAEPFRARHRDTGPNEVMIIGTPDHAHDYSLSINYRHNDSEVQGRAWFTRIGIERSGPDSPLRVTILLETSEVSPQAATTPVTPSQPGIVHEILKRCSLDHATPGAQVRTLVPALVEDLKQEIARPDRAYAVIVVSVDDFSEVPNIDIETLRTRLVGLAQIYSIPTKRDAWKLRDGGLLPSYHTAWDGSISVISPGRADRAAFGRVYRINEIEAITEDTSLTFDRFLFNELTHRFNLAKSRRHIGDAVVGRRLVAFKLATLREKVGSISGLQEIVESYEKDRDDAKRQAEELEGKLLDVEIQNEKLREQTAALEKQVRTLQFNLKQAKATAATTTQDTAEEPILPKSLEAIPQWAETEHPARLIFTGKATRTLKDSPFEDLDKVAKAFRILANQFHAAFTGELQFQDAVDSLNEIPAKYSGKQSEITAGMKDGYECTHNGSKYFLNKHIGIGTSRDPRYCFRLYFEWVPASKQIIVLHAGKHLDTQST